MHSISAHSRPVSQRGVWYDGKTAADRPVDVLAEARGLMLIDAADEQHRVDVADLVRIYSPAGELRFGHRNVEGWRLVMSEPVEPRLLALLPAAHGSLTPGIGRRKMSVLVGFTAIVSVVAATVIFAPEVFARHMPMSWERKLGSGYELPISAIRCSDDGAQEALNAIVDRVDPAARRDGFSLELVDLGIANAVALPGGRMVIFKGLLPDAGSPDAIAGIVAHEIAHVRRRHVAAAMVRQMGLSTVITSLGGGAVAANAGDLLSLKFSRGAESQADSDAVGALRSAGIDPRPTAHLFEKFAREAGEGSGLDAEFLQTHPQSTGRAKLFASSFDARRTYRPVLDKEQAEALRTACR